MSNPIEINRLSAKDYLIRGEEGTGNFVITPGKILEEIEKAPKEEAVLQNLEQLLPVTLTEREKEILRGRVQILLKVMDLVEEVLSQEDQGLEQQITSETANLGAVDEKKLEEAAENFESRTDNHLINRLVKRAPRGKLGLNILLSLAILAPGLVGAQNEAHADEQQPGAITLPSDEERMNKVLPICSEALAAETLEQFLKILTQSEQDILAIAEACNIDSPLLKQIGDGLVDEYNTLTPEDHPRPEQGEWDERVRQLPIEIQLTNGQQQEANFTAGDVLEGADEIDPTMLNAFFQYVDAIEAVQSIGENNFRLSIPTELENLPGSSEEQIQAVRDALAERVSNGVPLQFEVIKEVTASDGVTYRPGDTFMLYMENGAPHLALAPALRVNDLVAAAVRAESTNTQANGAEASFQYPEYTEEPDLNEMYNLRINATDHAQVMVKDARDGTFKTIATLDLLSVIRTGPTEQNVILHVGQDLNVTAINHDESGAVVSITVTPDAPGSAPYEIPVQQSPDGYLRIVEIEEEEQVEPGAEVAVENATVISNTILEKIGQGNIQIVSQENRAIDAESTLYQSQNSSELSHNPLMSEDAIWDMFDVALVTKLINANLDTFPDITAEITAQDVLDNEDYYFDLVRNSDLTISGLSAEAAAESGNTETKERNIVPVSQVLDNMVINISVTEKFATTSQDPNALVRSFITEDGVRINFIYIEASTDEKLSQDYSPPGGGIYEITTPTGDPFSGNDVGYIINLVPVMFRSSHLQTSRDGYESSFVMNPIRLPEKQTEPINIR